MTVLSAIAEVSTASANFNARLQVYTHVTNMRRMKIYCSMRTSYGTTTNTLLLKGHRWIERVQAMKLLANDEIYGEMMLIDYAKM